MASNDRRQIELRGVRVHNLQNVDLDLPLGELIVVTGVSGSGKSSLAFDTLYAEGQRRYIETFSAYARQFLDRLEKPDADRIDNIPPAAAVRQNASRASRRATVSTATEIDDYLQLLFARLGRVVCPDCNCKVRCDNAADGLRTVRGFEDAARFQIAFPVASGSRYATDDPDAETTDATESHKAPPDLAAVSRRLLEDGFHRVVFNDQTVNLPEVVDAADNDGVSRNSLCDELLVVLDRLVAGTQREERLADSFEAAFRHGDGRCVILEAIEESAANARPTEFLANSATTTRRSTEFLANSATTTRRSTEFLANSATTTRTIDGRAWRVHRFDSRLACPECGRKFVRPEPRLFNPNSPLGACETCRGFGGVPAISFERLVPDPAKSLREGAIAAWTTPAYRHELDELLELAGDYDLPVDVPFQDLEPRHLDLIREGVPERDFGGLKGFFRWLERNRYKTPVRVFLSRWRAYETCPACDGARLNPDALAVRIEGLNAADFTSLTVDEAARFVEGIPYDGRPRPSGLSDAVDGRGRPSYGDADESANSTRGALDRALDTVVGEIAARLQYLQDVGLNYLTLSRTLRSLSGGEAQRVALTSILASRLVNTLYVLDEPSAGLHPADGERIITAVRRLRDAGNTVLVVEHEDAFIRAADHVVDVGPGAGRDGGQIVFTGSPDALVDCEESTTAAYLSGRSSIPAASENGGALNAERIRLTGAREHNLKNLTVEFPMGGLVVVTGVSGSGKSTLVEDTLHPALCRALGQTISDPPGEHDGLEGAEHLDEVVLVDRTPVGRTARSNPVTYLKAFDEIRKVFAETHEAKLRNFTTTDFSFNAARGGRCPHCKGTGAVEVDMQFLADVLMTCPECRGTRYRSEILEAKYRGLSIADALDLTVREAFTFFRTQGKLQKRLKPLIDVGLDYLPLGQPATTLSGGESQRLKLASYLTGSKRSRMLFLLDEPTTGLHAADVSKLLECLRGLVNVGRSLIVIEHNLDVIRAADWIIDLGPGAGDAGGSIVVEGSPADVAAHSESITGRFL